MKRLALACILAAAIVVSGCVQDGGEDIVLSDGMVLTQEQCASRGIQESVVVFFSPGCPACARALPVLEEIQGEMPDRDFRFINIAEDTEDVAELRMVPTHVPTVVARCHVIVGAKTKEEYLSYIR